jgi:hypothetical protein
MGPNDLKNSGALSWRNRIAVVPRLMLLESTAVARLNEGLEKIETATGQERKLEPSTRMAPKLVTPLLKVTQPGKPPVVIP